MSEEAVVRNVMRLYNRRGSSDACNAYTCMTYAHSTPRRQHNDTR